MFETLFWKISRQKNGIAKCINNQARLYINSYNDFSYDFDKNGESVIIKKIAIASQSFNMFFDVGANIGNWSKMVLEYFSNCTIHAFELSEITRDGLKKNLHNHNSIVVAESGLGSTEGHIQYKDYGYQSNFNTITTTEFHDSRKKFSKKTAKIITGDSYMKLNKVEKVDFLKVDVEGFEFQVLQGFEKALKNHQIRVIQFEYGYANGDAGYLMKDFYRMLLTSGYQIGKIWTLGVQFSSFDYSMNNFDSGPNYLAVANTEDLLIEKLRSPI